MTEVDRVKSLEMEVARMKKGLLDLCEVLITSPVVSVETAKLAIALKRQLKEKRNV
jgi:hypothetical protein